MSEKAEKNQRAGWKAWVVPSVVSVLVFVILASAQAVSPFLAVLIASIIVGGGAILLKLL